MGEPDGLAAVAEGEDKGLGEAGIEHAALDGFDVVGARQNSMMRWVRPGMAKAARGRAATGLAVLGARFARK